MDLLAVERATRSECAALLAAVAQRLITLDDAGVHVDDRALDVQEAAGLLGMSPASLYKVAHARLSGLRIDNGSRSLKFSRVKIQDYLRRNDRQDAGSMPPFASGRRGVSRTRALAEPSAATPLRAPTGERR